MIWHILDAKSIWLKEFAFSLGKMVRSYNWCPQIRSFGCGSDWEKINQIPDPALTTIEFPLQRGYARFPISRLAHWETAMVARLARRSRVIDRRTTLICTSPFYAPVAELWPGRVIYYLTDLTKAYAGIDAGQVVDLDRKMCRVAELVCPNSRRIADYLIREAGCDPQKITVIPNATRVTNILARPLTAPAEVPSSLSTLPRPIVGVIGNLASNVDWVLLRETVDRARDISWAFVGPTEMHIPDPNHRQARQDLIRRRGRVRFTGPKPYGELCDYARAFDVALIPYRREEPTRSGSATRFYEHLAACRPILATRVHDELLTKEPLLKLIATAEELLSELECLRARNFRDGYEELRWRVSRSETWDQRARAMLAATGAEDDMSILDIPGELSANRRTQR